MRSIAKYLFLLMISSTLFAQKVDTTRVVPTDSSKVKKSFAEIYKDEMSDSTRTFLKFNPTFSRLPPIRMPLYNLSDKQKRLGFRIEMENRVDTDALKRNWTDVTLPSNQTNYNLDYYYFRQLAPILPLHPSPEPEKPLTIFDYKLPTRKEMDILELLWMKENVTDTTIYSCLDTMMNITFHMLNQLLEKMTDKKLVSRKIVSPRHEFNAFGVLIEMSMKNRRNRVYEYKSRVDRQVMKKFIDANAYLFKSDSSIVNLKQLRAARQDSTLLKDLDRKMKLKK